MVRRKVEDSGSEPEYDEDDESASEEEEEDEEPVRKSGRARKRKKIESDDDDEEEDDKKGSAPNGSRRGAANGDSGAWIKDAKKSLKVIFDHRENDGIFNEPVNAKVLGLKDYHSVVKKPMDLGTVKKKLNKHQYDTWQDFVNDVHLTFRNAILYNPENDGVHLSAVKLLKKFQGLWNEAHGSKVLKFEKKIPRIAGEDEKDDDANEEEKEEEEQPRDKGGRKKGRGASRHDDAEESDASGYAGREKRHREQTKTYAMEAMMEETRKRNADKQRSRMEKYVKDSMAAGRRGRPPGGGRGYGGRKSTVVSEGGKKFRVVETDASESGEDVPSKSGGWGGGGGFGGGGGRSRGGGGGGGGNYPDSDDEGGGFGGMARTGSGGQQGDQSIAPINANADINTIENAIDFSAIGGLEGHIRQLKESVFLPLTYPEVFAKLGVQPPSGVLFHGPPGTGKTMMARALASSCSYGDRKISFFMRKGADCLSKFVGETERQLRLLFQEAQRLQPSIIFFDEIDGLAPVRSSRQDYIHSSIVSTLLALMDGLDKRGQIVLIGATNRPDSVDPALRRPGRFDREFYFPLPDAAARASILKIYTKDWKPSLAEETLQRAANLCAGFGGADLRALCTESALRALRRTYPQVYTEDARLKIDKDKIFVTDEDISEALGQIKSCSARSSPSLGLALPQSLHKPLQPHLLKALEHLSAFFPPAIPALHRLNEANALEQRHQAEQAADAPDAGAAGAVGAAGAAGAGKDVSGAVAAGKESFTVGQAGHELLSFHGRELCFRPRALFHGRPGDAHLHVARALIQALDPTPCFGLDLLALNREGGGKLEEVLVSKFADAEKRAPCVIFMPNFHTWWQHASASLKAVLEAALSSLAPSAPVLLLATVDCERNFDLGSLLRQSRLFSEYHTLEFAPPSREERQLFFAALEADVRTWRKHPRVAPPPPKLEREELPAEVWERPKVVDPQQKEREAKALRGMRMNLRKVCGKLLANRKFKDFFYPVLETLQDPLIRACYKKTILKPMDLATVLMEVDKEQIRCVSHFMERIDLIRSNAIKFNGPGGPEEATTPRPSMEGMEAGGKKKMYEIPEQQDKVLLVGSIVEIEVVDQVDHLKEWIPAKVVHVDPDPAGKGCKFKVHVVVHRDHEAGEWEDDFDSNEENKDWRWPSAKDALKRKQELENEVKLKVRQYNDHICTSANQLYDEAEDECEKLDSWLIKECERIVEERGLEAPAGGGLRKVPRLDKPRSKKSVARERAALEKAKCGVCGKADQESELLVCDHFARCKGARHLFCLDPPLGEVPPGPWFCPACVAQPAPQPTAPFPAGPHGAAPPPAWGAGVPPPHPPQQHWGPPLGAPWPGAAPPQQAPTAYGGPGMPGGMPVQMPGGMPLQGAAMGGYAAAGNYGMAPQWGGHMGGAGFGGMGMPLAAQMAGGGGLPGVGSVVSVFQTVFVQGLPTGKEQWVQATVVEGVPPDTLVVQCEMGRQALRLADEETLWRRAVPGSGGGWGGQRDAALDAGTQGAAKRQRTDPMHLDAPAAGPGTGGAVKPEKQVGFAADGAAKEAPAEKPAAEPVVRRPAPEQSAVRGAEAGAQEVQMEPEVLDHVSEDPTLLSDLTEYMDYVVEVASADASWEKLLQLNAAIYHIVSLERYTEDRPSVLDKLKRRTSEWACQSR